ncbi:MAG: hypothetical protein NTU44_00205, partial [Bacteroidetes bacterium]|nr:hypothetical protein [Bacteroidota bacterium]
NPRWPLELYRLWGFKLGLIVAVIEILGGHLSLKKFIYTSNLNVAVIEILGGHLSFLIAINQAQLDSRSDRNPRWPLEQKPFMYMKQARGRSDRNPRWPLEHKDIKISTFLPGFLRKIPVAIRANHA